MPPRPGARDGGRAGGTGRRAGCGGSKGDVITTEHHGPVALVILDRPGARNALTGAMIADLATALARADADPGVAAVVLTGRDPAFCAGLDLTDLVRTYDDIADAPRGDGDADAPRIRRGLTPETTKPRIGAVNGPAVTGGLELALGCDFLIASERATFADTHARVGVLPAGGMTIRLPQLIGVNRARQMSLTGDFVDAPTACAWRLVNEVVPHDQLLPRSLELAGAIAESDPVTVAELRAMYGTLAHRGDEESYRDEARWSRRWMKERFDPDAFRARRDGIIERGSSQQG